MQENTNLKYSDIPRKMNDCIEYVKHLAPTERLFDDFWHEGEMALMYGPDRIGKSVLAVQIGEAVARGRKIDGFLMPEGGRKVLYVDLRLTERQFIDRYRLEGTGNEAPRSYEFAENFYRATPSDLSKIVDWIREKIEERGFQAVIIDDLQALQTGSYGIKEVMDLAGEMRKLCLETGVSVLLIAGSEASGNGKLADERDLRQLRAICRRADSTFAIAKCDERTEDRYLLQTRSPRRLYWTSNKAPICKMWSGGEVPLGFVFDERFRADKDSERRSLILAIKQARDHGESFASIAECFDIPKTKAFRLYREWRPSMEYTKRQIAASIAEEEAEERQALDRARKAEIEEQNARAEFEENSARMNEQLAGVFEPESETVDEETIEPEAEPSVDIDPMSELTPMTDLLGKEIYVEKFDDRGKPEVWYRYDNNARIHHMQRDCNGISGQKVDGPVSWLQWSGSDEYYYKKQMDLISQSKDPPDAIVAVNGAANMAQFAVEAQMR